MHCYRLKEQTFATFNLELKIKPLKGRGTVGFGAVLNQ